MKAIVDMPNGMGKETFLPFIVNRINDLNIGYKTLEKVENKDTKESGICCLNLSCLSLSIVLNKSGFVCGEKIQIIGKVF